VAKNYLLDEEVRELNRIVTMFLDVAEDRAERRKAMSMADWAAELDRFLTYNERPVLRDAGRVSHGRMENLTAERYESFDKARKAAETASAEIEHDEELKAIEQLARKKKKPV
jgi:hypothetical protein